jgi:hypothetical protein
VDTPQTRRWQRLAVAVPVFARGVDEKGKEFVEFTTLLNLGGGGGLLAYRRSAPRSPRMLLEIPSPPMPGLPLPANCVQKLKSRVVHVMHSGPYDFLGVEFTRPLLKPMSPQAKSDHRPRRGAPSPTATRPS